MPTAAATSTAAASTTWPICAPSSTTWSAATTSIASGGLSLVFVDLQDPRLGTREGLSRHLLRGLRLPLPPSPNERCDLDGFMNRVSDGLRIPTGGL